MTNSEPDQFLAKFVFDQFFASGADEFILDVTLAVDGLLISGRPISSKRFFDLLGAGLPEEIGRQVQSLFSPSGPGVSKMLLSPRDLNKIREHVSDHWHLENATILGAGPQPVSVGLWRGRLADISGWTFGAFGQSEPGMPDVPPADLVQWLS